MDFFISKDILSNPCMGNYELLTYYYLKALAPFKEIEKYCINMNNLIYIIYGKRKVSQEIRQNIYGAINRLLDEGMIKGECCGRGEYIIESTSMYVDTHKQNFVAVNIEDVQTIMRSNLSVRVPLVRYYIYLISTINSQTAVRNNEGNTKKNVIGNQTQDYLSGLTGNSVWTIRRYNQLLEDMKVVYIYRAEDFLLSNNQVKQLPNVYGRYSDKEYIIQYGKELQEQNRSRNYTRPKLAQSDNKRRLYKMYYWLCQGKEYSESEIREIYEYVITENEKYRKLAESKQDKRYLEKLKDETVFAKYPFLFQGEE